jgi:hypothetical protein
MDNELQQLKQRIADLEKWKADKEKQQIKYPLDQESLEVLNKYYIRLVESTFYYAGASGHPFPLMITRQGTQLVGGFLKYTANPANDTITIASGEQMIVYGHDWAKFANGTQVFIYTNDTEPGGLVAGTGIPYFVVDASGDGRSFKLEASVGGGAIDITSAGSGQQFITRWY